MMVICVGKKKTPNETIPSKRTTQLPRDGNGIVKLK